jgi:hypothetical protein
MSDPNETLAESVQRERERWERVSVTAQEQEFLDAYRERGVREFDADRHRQYAAEAVSQREAEALRISLARGAVRQLSGPPADAGPPPESAGTEMSDRGKTKADKRGEKQRRRARKKYGPGATEHTATLARGLREYRTERAEAEKSGEEATFTEWQGTVGFADTEWLKNAFDSLLKPGGGARFEAKKLLDTHRKLTEYLAVYDRMPEEERAALQPEERARMEEVRLLSVSRESTLRIAFAANGLDLDTGRPVEPAVAEWAKERLGAEVQSYKAAFGQAEETTLDGLAEHVDEKVREKLASPEFTQMRESEAETAYEANPALRELPVAYSPYLAIKADEYLGIRKAMTAHPEAYEANRETVDRMMAELMDVWNKLAEEDLYYAAIEMLRLDTLGKNGRSVDPLKTRMYQHHMFKRREEVTRPVEARFDLLRGGVRYLLTGEDLVGTDSSAMKIQLENEFGVVTELRRAEKEEVFSAEERLRVIESLGGKAEWSGLYSDGVLRLALHFRRDKARRDNLMRDLDPKNYQGDGRVLRTFARGYDVNGNGEPATAEDLADKEADAKFIADYASGDAALRAPHLDRIVEELVHSDITEDRLADMMTDEHMYANSARLYNLVSKGCYMQNMKKENPEYFNSLPAFYKARLDFIMDFSPKYTGLFQWRMGARGFMPGGPKLTSEQDMKDAADADAITTAQYREWARSAQIAKLGGAAELSGSYTEDALRYGEAMAGEFRRRNNFERDFVFEKTLPAYVDGRVVRAFARGYETDRNGEPLTETDRINKEADETFVREYFDPDQAVRARQLDRMTDEVLSIEIGEREMTEEYIRDHGAEMKLLADKACYLENAMDANKAYFDSLPPEKAELLKAVKALSVALVGLYQAVYGAWGVHYNVGRLIGSRETGYIDKSRASLDFMRANCAAALASYRAVKARVGAGAGGPGSGRQG